MAKTGGITRKASWDKFFALKKPQERRELLRLFQKLY